MAAIRPRSSYNFPGPLSPAKMTRPANEFFLHHSVTAAANGANVVRNVANIGVQRFGRASYSFAITLDGAIYEMQGDNIGAHTANRNSTSFGVVLVGNYDNTQMTNAQINSVAWLYRNLVSRGLLRSGAPIRGHRDVSATACPGRTAYAALAQIRHLVNAGGGSTPPPGGGSGGGSGALLRRGSTGQAVRQWQTVLHGAGLLPANGVDGIFGPQTEAATKAFQRTLRVSADGIVGPQTRAATSQLFKFLAGSGGGGGSTPSPSRPTIRRGSTGAHVRNWQTVLRGAGLLPANGVDGIFGPQTENATRAFQRKLKVSADGIVGPVTWAATDKLFRFLAG